MVPLPMPKHFGFFPILRLKMLLKFLANKVKKKQYRNIHVLSLKVQTLYKLTKIFTSCNKSKVENIAVWHVVESQADY